MDTTNIIKEWNERKEKIMSDAKEWDNLDAWAAALAKQNEELKKENEE